MKIRYFSEVNEELSILEPRYYPANKQTEVQKDGATYVKIGRVFTPLSILDRLISGFVVATLSVAIIPLAIKGSRKYIKQLGKSVFRGTEKTICYIHSPKERFPILLKNMAVQMKAAFINDVITSATCFVKIEKDGNSYIRQYIFANQDKTLVQRAKLNDYIDKIKESISNDGPHVHSFKQQWVIVVQRIDGTLYGSCGGSEPKIENGLYIPLSPGCKHNKLEFWLGRMGMDQPFYRNNQFIAGRYLQNLT